MKFSWLVALGLWTPTTAHADAYAWGGTSGRFSVDVVVAGFDEGAGEGGWNEVDARDFAAWAKRFDAVIPRGASVTMTRDAADDTTTLSIHDRGETLSIEMPEGPDFGAAIAIVASLFHARVPPMTRVPLYTLQVFASRSEARANAFAASLDARDVAAPGSFFRQACLPCKIPEAHVQGATRDVFHRVILGVYDRRENAERARAALPMTSWVTILRE